MAAQVKIYKRGDRLWLSKFINGEKVRISSGLNFSPQNEKWLTKNKDSEFNRLIAHKNKPSVDFYEYGLYVLDSTRSDRIKQSNDENMHKLKKLAEFFKKDVTEIKYSDVLVWQNDMLSNYAPKTVKNYRSVLNMILKTACFDELISKNPLEQLKAPKEVKELPHFYSTTDIKKIIDNSIGQFKNLVQFAYFSGMRPSEIIALEWNDVNLDTNTIKVDKRIRDGKVGLPKGGKARIIDLLPQAKEALLNQQFNTGMKTYIFVTQYGKRYNTPDTLDINFKKTCTRAGVKIDKFYNTKHTFTTMMLENGMNETWLTQQLGHEKIDVTRKHYVGKIKQNFDQISKIAI